MKVGGVFKSLWLMLPSTGPGLRGPEDRDKVIAMSALRDQIANLTAAEKAELLDEVWESLETDALALTDAQRAELDFRIERLEQNPSDVIPWERVRSDLFKKP
jgi:putative addiction module component (TIGR02574 family)